MKAFEKGFILILFIGSIVSEKRTDCSKIKMRKTLKIALESLFYRSKEKKNQSPLSFSVDVKQDSEERVQNVIDLGKRGLKFICKNQLKGVPRNISCSVKGLVAVSFWRDIPSTLYSIEGGRLNETNYRILDDMRFSPNGRFVAISRKIKKPKTDKKELKMFSVMSGHAVTDNNLFHEPWKIERRYNDEFYNKETDEFVVSATSQDGIIAILIFYLKGNRENESFNLYHLDGNDDLVKIKNFCKKHVSAATFRPRGLLSVLYHCFNKFILELYKITKNQPKEIFKEKNILSCDFLNDLMFVRPKKHCKDTAVKIYFVGDDKPQLLYKVSLDRIFFPGQNKVVFYFNDNRMCEIYEEVDLTKEKIFRQKLFKDKNYSDIVFTLEDSLVQQENV